MLETDRGIAEDGTAQHQDSDDGFLPWLLDRASGQQDIDAGPPPPGDDELIAYLAQAFARCVGSGCLDPAAGGSPTDLAAHAGRHAGEAGLRERTRRGFRAAIKRWHGKTSGSGGDISGGPEVTVPSHVRCHDLDCEHVFCSVCARWTSLSDSGHRDCGCTEGRAVTTAEFRAECDRIEDERRRRDHSAPGRQNWGPWRLDPESWPANPTLTNDAGRQIDLLDCASSDEVLRRIVWTAARADADDTELAGFVRALKDLLGPVVTLPVEGRENAISRIALGEILGRRVEALTPDPNKEEINS